MLRLPVNWFHIRSLLTILRITIDSTIAVMRSAGESYKAIAKALNLSLNTVQTFCRRNQLTGMISQRSRL